MYRRLVEGYDPDLAIATPGDVFPLGGAYVLPSAAAATTVLSSDGDDDSASGDGAATVRIHGLDSSYKLIAEDATMEGAVAVTLTKQFLRVNLIEVLTAGSTGPNVGAISVKHGGTIIGTLSIGEGRSRMGFFSPWANIANWRVVSVSIAALNVIDGLVRFQLQTRKVGGVFQARWERAVHGVQKPSYYERLDSPIILDAGEDVRWRATSTTDSMAIAAGFNVEAQSGPFD